ncbi:putative G-protein coupled receptor CG31760 [Babylonia areolata]|uniref:putative G-protein coupled receptor CG31760 n=1 Tax=Babylonia areolata TaxID=304850 RepID=UPI003FD06CD1
MANNGHDHYHNGDSKASKDNGHQDYGHYQDDDSKAKDYGHKDYGRYQNDDIKVNKDESHFQNDDSSANRNPHYRHNHNHTLPWPEHVTQPSMGSADHVGDGVEGAEVPGERGEEGETDKDVVQKFLEQVEKYEKNKANCTAGTHHNLGKGVIKQYGLNRFKAQALVAVNRANFLSRIWKEGNPQLLASEYFFFTQVRSMVEGDPEIFAAGNCYDQGEFKDYYLFCPYAYRTGRGDINVKDLSVEYDYLGNSSEWFYTARHRASDLRNFSFTEGTVQWRYNQSMHMAKEVDTVVSVRYKDGHWSLPYFDCGGGDIWMMTYTVPFFAYTNGTPKFKGTSGIDIDLQKVDIDQCPSLDSTEENVFAGSHKCKPATTRCEHMSGLGFRRGSYQCVCKKGFYFPDVKAAKRYYPGTVVEEQYERKRKHLPNNYDAAFECLQCAPGCEHCTDPSPCVLTLNWLQRSILLGVSGLIVCFILVLLWFTIHYREVKVMKAASPVLMRVVLLGAFFLYCPLIVGYFEATVATCCIQFWLREIGFSISYGALLLKTWRISVVFRVRSAQRIKISDGDLIKRLLVIVFVFSVYLTARTVAGTPRVVQGEDVSGLKAFICSSDWWDHSAAIAEMLFLLWGVRLCIVVRKAPSEFNESRFISWAIYNEFLLSLFLNVSMIFLKDPFPTNPDLLYLVLFVHTQLTTTVTLAFLFGTKAYLVYKYRGKEQTSQGGGTTMISRGSKYNKASNLIPPTSLTNPVASNGGFGDRGEEEECESFLEKDIQEEFRRLYTQLEVLKQRNMKLGNRHLQHKLSAMTEAATKDDPPADCPLPPSPNLASKRIVINLDDYNESTNV